MLRAAAPDHHVDDIAGVQWLRARVMAIEAEIHQSGWQGQRIKAGSGLVPRSIIPVMCSLSTTDRPISMAELLSWGINQQYPTSLSMYQTFLALHPVAALLKHLAASFP